MIATFRRRCAVLASTTLGLGLLSSCVAKTQYDEALERAKHYEQRYYDLEAREQGLRDENGRLARQLQASESGVLDASADFEARVKARMSELDKIMAEIGTNPGDATKFQVEGGYVYRVKEAILFALGSSEISSEGNAILKKIAGDVNRDPRGRVYVRGHTDNVPIAKPESIKKYPMGNVQLSVDRALNVAQVLTKEGGVPNTRIVVMGFGENEPVVANDSTGNRQKNRRVEIFVATEEQEGLSGS